MKQIFLNSKKKPVRVLCAIQDWSPKIILRKSKMFYKRKILRKHPQIAKNAFKVLKIGFFSPISTEGIKENSLN